MKKFKSIACMMGKGFVRSIWGTAVTASIAVAVHGYMAIPADVGFIAVAEFILASIFMGVALSCMYIMGGTCKKGAKK